MTDKARSEAATKRKKRAQDRAAAKAKRAKTATPQRSKKQTEAATTTRRSLHDESSSEEEPEHTDEAKNRQQGAGDLSTLEEKLRLMEEKAIEQEKLAASITEKLMSVVDKTQVAVSTNTQQIDKIQSESAATQKSVESMTSRITNLESKYNLLITPLSPNRPTATNILAAEPTTDPFQEALEGVDNDPKSSISRILRMNRKSLALKPKKLREGIAHLAQLLSEVHGCRIPFQLAQAIFEKDTAQMMKYAPIMGEDAQEEYEEKLGEKARMTAATISSIAEEILKGSISLTKDEAAEEVVTTETNDSMNSWLLNAWIYVKPLLVKWWDPILSSTSKNFDSLVAKVRVMAVGFQWDLTSKAIRNAMLKERRVFGQYSRTRTSESLMTWKMFNICDQFEMEFQRQQLKALRNLAKTSNATPSGTSKNGSRARPREDQPEGREDLRREMAKDLGREFKLDFRSIRSLPWHANPKTGESACLFGCAKEIFGVGTECTRPKCGRSHVAKDCYPHGRDCVVGKCPKDCASRKENMKKE